VIEFTSTLLKPVGDLKPTQNLVGAGATFHPWLWPWAGLGGCYLGWVFIKPVLNPPCCHPYNAGATLGPTPYKLHLDCYWAGQLNLFCNLAHSILQPIVAYGLLHLAHLEAHEPIVSHTVQCMYGILACDGCRWQHGG
jgi:hypothetical protein